MNPRKNNTKLEKTYDFLDCCKEVKIKLVALHVITPLIPTSMKWTRDKWYELSAFSEGRCNGWPAIWKACELFSERHYKIGSAGNTDQMQIDRGLFTPGVYKFDTDWIKLPKENEVGSH